MLKAKLVVRDNQAMPLQAASLRELIKKAERHPVGASQRRLVIDLDRSDPLDWAADGDTRASRKPEPLRRVRSRHA
jgi:hypothetical protein